MYIARWKTPEWRCYALISAPNRDFAIIRTLQMGKNKIPWHSLNGPRASHQLMRWPDMRPHRREFLPYAPGYLNSEAP